MSARCRCTRALRGLLCCAVITAASPCAVATDAASAGETPSPARASRRTPPQPLPPPAVPPERAAKAIATVPILNGGFESTAWLEGWAVGQHAGPASYTFEPDTAITHSGARSLRVTNIGPEPYGAILQAFAAEPYRGKMLRLAAWLRTEGVTGNRFAVGAGLRMYATPRYGPVVEAAETMRNGARGTTEWTRYEIAFKVPADADRIDIGMALYGPGSVWVDDIACDVIAAPAQ